MTFSPEFPNTNEAELTMDLVHDLKRAAMIYKVPEMEWNSSDSQHFFTAKPIQLPGTPEQPDITKIGDIPAYRFGSAFNAWVVVRSEPLEDGTRLGNIYHIGAGMPLIARTVTIPAPTQSSERLEAEVEKMNESLVMQIGLKLIEPSVEDYAVLDDGIQELTRLADQIYEDQSAARRSEFEVVERDEE